MKKLLLGIPVFLLLGAAIWAFAAGDTYDPLASLSYLNGAFTQTVDQEVEDRLNQSDEALLDQAGNGTGSPTSAAWTEVRLKSMDALHGSTGASVLLLTGSGQVVYSSGAVVDATTGTVVSSGTPLSANHRYLVAEDTAASFSVTSKTAVVN